MAAILTFDVVAFRAQFPAFAASPPTDATLQMYWDTATNFVSNLNYGCLINSGRQLAINLMTAHLYSLSVIIAAGQQPGQVNSATIDKVSVSLTMPPNANQFQWWLNLTPYGSELLALLSVSSVGGFYYGGMPETSGLRRFGGR